MNKYKAEYLSVLDLIAHNKKPDEALTMRELQWLIGLKIKCMPREDVVELLMYSDRFDDILGLLARHFIQSYSNFDASSSLCLKNMALCISDITFNAIKELVQEDFDDIYFNVEPADGKNIYEGYVKYQNVPTDCPDYL